jgi:hypothetical protein
MNDEQTLVLYSGHPMGLFLSNRDAPRLVVTNGMVIPNYSSCVRCRKGGGPAGFQLAGAQLLSVIITMCRCGAVVGWLPVPFRLCFTDGRVASF